MAPEGVFWDSARARRREHSRQLSQLQTLHLVAIFCCFLVLCFAYIIWGDAATHAVWPRSVGRSLPSWVFSPWVWAPVTGLHTGSLFATLVGPPVIVHIVARRKFVWKVGAWWAAGFLCEAFAFASGAQVSNSNNYLRISAVFLLAAACFFHVPVLGANFRSLYRSCMITWVALDAASQNLRRSEAPNRFPQRRFFSSPSMPAASGGDSPGHIALTPIGPSSSRATNVAYAQNLGRVNPPARQHTNNAAQQERASDFFKVHLQLALVTVATSVHASLLLAPAANLLLASTGSSSIGSSAQHVTALRILLLCAIVLAWGVAVCVRWNVIYGVAVSCVLLSLPVGQGVLSMVHTDNNWLDIKVGEPLWASMSRSPRLLACVVFVALGVLLFVAVGHHFLEQLFSPRDNEGYGGVLGSSGYLGSEALEEPLAGNGTSGQLQQVRQPVHSFHSFEMNALMDDDSELESM